MNCFRSSNKYNNEVDLQNEVRRPGTDSNPEVNRLPDSLVTNIPVSISDPGIGQISGENEDVPLIRRPRELREFTYVDLKTATKNFASQNLLGEGGFGRVYRGVIKQKYKYDGGEEKREVAIKQLNTNGVQGHTEWVTEVHFLGLVNSPYLVKLIGYCAEDDARGMQRLLVYEFMPNRGLDDHMFRTTPPTLTWQTRVKIALGAARGLAYLHEEMDVQVIFRDFKTSNVLLDDEFNPKLSDFGLARQGPDVGKSHVTTGVKGTYGYAAPEYIQTGHLTFKSDVWSFGVVMLEMLTGRRAMDRNRPKMEQRLLEWVKPYLRDPSKFHQIIDPQLELRYPPKAALKFGSIATQCLVKQPKGRPKMSNVVEGLKKVLEMTFMWEIPAPQPTLVARSNTRTVMDRNVDGIAAVRSPRARARTPTLGPDTLSRSPHTPIVRMIPSRSPFRPVQTEDTPKRKTSAPELGKADNKDLSKGKGEARRWLSKILLWST